MVKMRFAMAPGQHCLNAFRCSTARQPLLYTHLCSWTRPSAVMCFSKPSDNCSLHQSKCYHSLRHCDSHKLLQPSVLQPTTLRISNQNHARPGQAILQFLSPQHIMQVAPSVVKPYLQLMRFDRPIGTWLLFLPCAWSISMAASPGALPDPAMLALFGLGSFFMRGAGCTINDMWDKDFDAKVARTKDRPIASGKVNQFNALAFLGAQLSVSLMILLSLNWNTIILGACSVIPCVIYPLMKRVTYWPQVFLGLTFNWGSVMGWTAITGGVQWSVVAPLYLSCLAWTLVYDTIYAHQDKEDDVLVGVKSTALRLGDNTKVWLSGFTTCIAAGLTGAGVLCDQTWPFYLGVSYVTAHLAHQIYAVDLNDPDDCGAKFRSNRNLGLAFWAAVVAGNLLKSKDEDDKQIEE
ncbi:hypothetical protein CAPTEDRAFT_154146 [Capitella teleta]|uniref:4-hydroxybenzoate polyprenyltransferase, mitochondrial n=1 Tax=Capitella teleta TaxID=283909 RepID=R7TDD2_CAPTE|nr:hypothetical protein CAPTEDRAFT_154146 [Capitella teleta]|eukprot:ELT89497.1 hypothetical protein CAPTEDRAFT_154146 [Capitella teleta]